MINRKLLQSFFPFASAKIYNKQQCIKLISKTTSEMGKIAEITFGPYGRNVLIQSEMQQPRITKDGVTVVKNIQYENRMEEAICALVKKSVDSTNKFAGDGTTTSTILIGEIMKIAYKKIACGANVRDVRKGFEIGRKLSLQFLDSCSRKITKKQQLLQIAKISTNNKTQIAELIADAVYSSNSVRVQKSQKQESFVQYHTGFTMPRGIDHKQFANSGLQKLIYNYPFIVTSLTPIKNIKQIVQVLQLAKKARKQVILFAPEFSQSIKSTLIYNNKKKVLECSCISFPQYGDKSKQLLSKISKLTDSYLFTQFSNSKIQQISWQHFGKAVKVQSDSFQTKIDAVEKNNTKNRQAVIFVGGLNSTSMLQNYDHVIDALNSTKSAFKDGIVAGGGVTFWRISELLNVYEGQGEEGVKILAQALKQPRKKLMKYVAAEKKPLSGNNWQGYDLSEQRIVDMFQAGIIDSVNVVKSTIIDSLSLCTVLVEVETGVGRQSKNLSQISLKQLQKTYKL